MITESLVDTHCHLDGEEFAEDLEQVIARAREAGVKAIGVPGIDLKSCDSVMALCERYPDFCFPMLGLHPEEVRNDWREVLQIIKLKAETSNLKPQTSNLKSPTSNHKVQSSKFKVQSSNLKVSAIGEIGLDFYWSREFEEAQLQAFEEQVRWSVESELPLMIHCRKAQNEMVAILKKYKDDLPGGVFHCFTGNALEAQELLQFEGFVLGIGGVLTFKKSKLPETLAEVVPLERIVLETDAPYMAPVPMRGQRNEPAFVAHVCKKLAEVYGVSEETVASVTTANAERVFRL